MKIITFASKKGGVGKTTSAILTGLMLSKKNKVLLIDLDSQNALTSFFFSDINEIMNKTVYELIKGETDIKDCIFNRGSLDVIPCEIEFEEVSRLNRAGKELILKREINKLNYDYIIIDTPPNLNTETIIGLSCANIIVIPAKLEKMDVRSIDFTLNKINNEISGLLNENIKNIYILPTLYLYNNRTINDLSLETLKEKYKSMVLDIIIKQDSKISQFNYIGYNNKLKIDFSGYKELIGVIK